MTFENIILEETETSVWLLTVNREKKLNALNTATLSEIQRALDFIEEKDGKILILTGAGQKAFVAGADISEMMGKDLPAIETFAALGQGVANRLESFAGITIAAVNGFALGGGCEISLACDWMVCTENASFGQPEVKIGVIPGFGGSQRLPRLVGKNHAMRMIVNGAPVKSDEALRIGLVNAVYENKEIMMAETLKDAKKILANSFNAVKLSKQAVQMGLDMDLANACLLEKSLFKLSFAHSDQKEGMGAFLEKRTPAFE